MSKPPKQMKASIRIAIVQEGPVYLNLGLSLQKAELLIEEAAIKGADLVVFGESWFCGYPAWLDHCPEVALWGHEPTKEVYARMFKNGMAVPGPATELLAGLARKHGIVIGTGANEIVPSGPGNGTIYNAFLLFDAMGQLVIHHRKQRPAFSEKLVYGLGDARGLKTVDTALGRVGGLISGEHFMPLMRQAMHDQGELVHLALWPCVHEMHQVASRHYAFEARCFVVAVGQLMRVRDIPPELDIPPGLAAEPDEWLLNGGSAVIAPDGFYDLQPQYGKEGIVYHTIDDLDHPLRERLTFNLSGQ